jgi:tetratricopeptide (TPR) repeat protein
MPQQRRNDDPERGDKLKAYDGKDYSEIIEFPVELVDRDGVVRRYSYEESLAVYHRRIQSAPWRYGDDDLIRAEIGHCTRRIDQIKRSYHARSRDGQPAPARNPRASLGEGWEVLHRFYSKVLSRRRLRLNGELPAELSLLSDEAGCRVYHVGFGSGTGGGGHLLYVYPFDRQGDQDPQGAYREAQLRFRGQSEGAEVERLLLSETGPLAGYLLTGTEELPAGLRSAAVAVEAPPEAEAGALSWLAEEGVQPWWSAVTSDESPSSRGAPEFEQGVDAMREERVDDAVDAFRRAIDENPYHREAYLALLAVLDGAGRYEEAELYGAMAARHLPGDGLVRYRQAINLVRQGRLAQAVGAFDEAAALVPTLYQPPYFAAHVLVARGRDLPGALRRLKAAAAVAEGEPHVQEALRGVRICLLLRQGMAASAVVLAVAAAAALAAVPVFAAVGALLAAGLGAGAGPGTALLARWLIQRRAPGGGLPGAGKGN